MNPRYGSAVLLLACAIGCAGEPSLLRLAEARRLTDDLLHQFTSAAVATNQTVMADGSDRAAEFARQAEAAITAANRDAEALKPLLESLGFAAELTLLVEFLRYFDDYRTIDRRARMLAIEGSNVKAHELALALGETGALAVRCEDSLRVLQAALGQREPRATR